MKRLTMTGLCAALVMLTLFIAFRQDAPADESLEQRVDALETRVAVLEQLIGTPAAEVASAQPTTAATPARPTEYAIEGTGPSLEGPFSLAEGRYRFSFQCDETAGFALLTDKKGATFGVPSENGQLGESIASVGPNADDLYVEINCDAHWTYRVVQV